jgi:protein tyrosine phosphatase
MRHTQQAIAHSFITSKMVTARMPHPFSYDYAYLNELARYHSQEETIQADHTASATQLKRNAQNRKMYFIESWFRHLYHKSDAIKQAELKKEWLGYYVLQQKKNYEFDRQESTSELGKVPVKEIAIAEGEIVTLENELNALTTKKFLDAENKSQDLESQISTLSIELENIDTKIHSLNNLIEESVKQSQTDNAAQEKIFEASDALEHLEPQQSRIKAALEELTTQLEVQKAILNNFLLEKINTLRAELSRLIKEQNIRKFHSKTIEDITRKLTELNQLSLNENSVFTNAAVESQFNASMKKTPSTWQAWATSTFEKRASEDKSADAFMTFVLESASSYLPEHYMPYNEVTAGAEFKFPGSASERVPYSEFAHVLTHASGAKLIASHVPAITHHDTEKNNASAQNFLGMLHKMNVSMIIDLGTDVDRSRRIAYHNVKNGQYTASLVEMQSESCDDDSDSEVDDDNFVSIAAKTQNYQTQQYSSLGSMHFKHTISQESRQIALCRIFVEDNASLDLNNNTLQTMLEAYRKYSKSGESVLVHCSSGVGRTGQIRLLFALLDAFSDDVSFKNACLSIITISLSDAKNAASMLLRESSLDSFFNKMSVCLCNLRRTRHCVQSEAQFNGTFSQFMLLAGKMIGLSNKDLNLLRTRLSMSQSVVSNVATHPVTPQLPGSSQSPSSNSRRPKFFGGGVSRALAASASAEEQTPNRPMSLND